jgi:uncharacterized protein (DUF427 family)
MNNAHIILSPAPKRLQVRWKGAVVADTSRAIDLKEGGAPVVKYVPREDVDMGLLTRTAHTTRCPFKGMASYFSITVDGQTSENAIWTYETPIAGMEGIAGCMAFYPNRVELSEVG